MTYLFQSPLTLLEGAKKDIGQSLKYLLEELLTVEELKKDGVKGLDTNKVAGLVGDFVYFFLLFFLFPFSSNSFLEFATLNGLPPLKRLG